MTMFKKRNNNEAKNVAKANKYGQQR